jgi:hypothetical protein
MTFTNDTLVWFFLAAVVVGVFIGGKVVLTIMQIMGKTMRPPMHNYPHQYPQPYDPHRPDMYPPTPPGDGCMFYILMGIIGLVIVAAVLNNTKIKDIFTKDKKEEVTTYPIESQHRRSPEPAERSVEVPTSPMPNAPEQFDPSWYALQAGVFNDNGNAFRKLESLSTMGFTPYYSISVIDGKKQFHVYAGVFPFLESLNSAKDSLNQPSAPILSAGGIEFYKYKR